MAGLTLLSADQFGLQHLLEIRPPSDFNNDAARKKLTNLNLASDDGPRINFSMTGDVFDAQAEEAIGVGIGRHEQWLRFAGFIDLDNGASVSSEILQDAL